jgi:hypothetical protein
MITMATAASSIPDPDAQSVAEKMFENVLSWRINRVETENVVEMTMRAGQCAMQCGNMEDTKKYARRALDILYKLHGEDAKTRRIAHCLYYLGMVAFKHEEDLHKAARYLREADKACVEAYVVLECYANSNTRLEHKHLKHTDTMNLLI